MKKNKFNIVIPTRERCGTLLNTIRTALNQDYENLSVIISDNFSQDSTQEIVSSFNDPRLKYYNTGARLSMTDNFEFALSKVSDGFVMFLGDDDGILPNVLNHINDLINQYNVSAITSYPAAYTWPNIADKAVANKLTWSGRNGVELRKTKEYLAEFFTFTTIYTFNLPGAYCGFVDKTVLDKARTKDGLFFHSQTPDAYSAFAISENIDEYLYSYKPFVIHGASASSNGGSYFSANNKKESNKFFSENTIAFHPELVVCPSFKVIAVETYLQFLDAFPQKDKIKIDWELFLKAAYQERQPHNQEIFDKAFKTMCALHQVDFSSLTNKVKKPPFDFSRVGSVINNFFKPYKLNSTDELGVNNIYDATVVLSVMINLTPERVVSRSSKLKKMFK